MKQPQAKKLFESIYIKTYQEAYGYLLAKTGDIQETPVILKTAYADFYKKLLRISAFAEDDGRSAVFKILHKHLLHYYKAHKTDSVQSSERKIKKYEKLTNEELETELQIQISKQEISEKLDIVVDHLSSKDITERRIFVLRYLFDFDIGKISDELNLDIATIGDRLYRITKEIRLLLTDETGREEPIE